MKINAGNLEDKSFVQKILEEGREIEDTVRQQEAQILEIVESKL